MYDNKSFIVQDKLSIIQNNLILYRKIVFTAGKKY